MGKSLILVVWVAVLFPLSIGGAQSFVRPFEQMTCLTHKGIFI